MRKGRPKERIILPDPKYKDRLVTKFVNNVMEDGKKASAFKIVYGALDTVAEKTNEDALEVFKKALSNVMPEVEVRSRRVGGATFQIPSQVREKRKVSLGMKWLIQFATKKGGRTMREKLASEILDAFKQEGGAVKKKEDTHRMAEANKAFSHFRF